MFLHTDKKPNQDKKNCHKIYFKISPEAQCIVGKFLGWYLVWEAYLFSDKFTYSKSFTYHSLSQYNLLLKHIKENRLRN